jgi:methylated-DNA-[protein]-cysteine S-methyltransferase
VARLRGLAPVAQARDGRRRLRDKSGRKHGNDEDGEDGEKHRKNQDDHEGSEGGDDEDGAAGEAPDASWEETMILHRSVINSPIGKLTLVARGEALVAVAFEGEEKEAQRWLRRRFGETEIKDHPDPAGAASALRAYFAGKLPALDRVKVDTGGTEFQRAVWSELRRIPAGGTISYAELAARLGRPTAVRAVGAANGSNPVPVVLPCHRVIAADGTLCGYGGGLPRKQWLLAHEGATPARPTAKARASTQMSLL